MSSLQPVHILAKPGDIASRVIVAGDPARVEQLSKLLEEPRLVNTNRGFLTFTGKYRGIDVTVATHGVGAPSASIVFEELIMLGAKVIIRLGTAGGLVPELHVGDIVVPTGAHYYLGGTIGMYIHDGVVCAVPDFDVLRTIIDTAKEHGLKIHIGPIVSSDAFYAEDENFVKKWSGRGAIAVEMECATLFVLGLLRKVKTGAVLVISDSLVYPKERKMKTAEELKHIVDNVGRIILESLVRIHV